MVLCFRLPATGYRSCQRRYLLFFGGCKLVGGRSLSHWASLSHFLAIAIFVGWFSSTDLFFGSCSCVSGPYLFVCLPCFMHTQKA